MSLPDSWSLPDSGPEGRVRSCEIASETCVSLRCAAGPARAARRSAVQYSRYTFGFLWEFVWVRLRSNRLFWGVARAA